MHNKKKTSIMKDAFALCAITLVAAVALGFVYEITKGPIAKAKAEKKAAAYAAVYEDAKLVDDTDEELNQLVADSKDVLATNGFEHTTIDEVCIAKDEKGNSIGYVMTITSHEGYAGDIQFSMGVKADGTLTKIEILSIKETAGLGMKAQDESFKGQFTAVKTEAFTVVKTQVANTSDGEINAITGATITSSAITNSVNAGLDFVADLMDEEIGGVVGE
jgi:electron transport complex protein RnfG